MIVKENVTFRGRDYIKTYSDLGYYIVDNDGMKYTQALDSVDKEYKETLVKIEEI